MTGARFYRTKSPKNRKGKYGTTYSMDLPLHQLMVNSFYSPKWTERIEKEHSKNITFTLKPPDEKEGGDETKEGKLWTLTATGKHYQTMENVASDMIDRYNKMIGVIKNIVKD